MKKVVLMLVMVATVSFVFTSCKKDKKEEVNSEETVVEGKEIADNHLYQCPMNCEEGKSYTEAGNCPVCKMALKEKSVDMDGKEHATDCTCKQGGECKCAPGECKCMADNDAGHEEKEGEDKDGA